MINKHGAVNDHTRVVDQFDAADLGAPFKVILNNSVKATFDAATGDMIDYTVPDLDGLLRTVVLTRILHRRKLSGAEVKFLRKAVGVKQKDLARAIEVTPEHLSRCEAGGIVLSPSTEKLLRVFLFKTAIKYHMKDDEAKMDLTKGLDQLFDGLSPSPVCEAGDELVLSFHWSEPKVDLNPANDPVWEIDEKKIA